MTDDVRDRLRKTHDDLARACTDWHQHRIGPHALQEWAEAACREMCAILEGVPEGEASDRGEDTYVAFRRLWAEVKILRGSLGPHSRELAGLYTGQGRLLADVEAMKDRLTKQDDRITGIATDLQGIELDMEKDRSDGK